jgi:hypothetical protein
LSVSESVIELDITKGMSGAEAVELLR